MQPVRSFGWGLSSYQIDRAALSIGKFGLTSAIGVQEDGKKLALVRDGVSLQQLVDGLNALGVGPRDIISILQAIKAAGALHAELKII